jgi:nucleoside 2-deoxyribosyltransferase
MPREKALQLLDRDLQLLSTSQALLALTHTAPLSTGTLLEIGIALALKIPALATKPLPTLWNHHLKTAESPEELVHILRLLGEKYH